MARPWICAALLFACAPKPIERAHDPVAPVVAQAPVVEPDPAGPPPRWADAGTPMACMPDHLASISLFPSSANFVAGIDAASVVGSGTWAELRHFVETGEAKTVIEIAHGCELGVGTWRGLTFGSETSGSNSVVVFRIDGIGRPERLECMRAAIERKQGKAPWTVTAGTAPVELALANGGLGIALDTCTLVVASPGWATQVRDRLLGSGGTAIDGALSAAVARTDTRKPAWMAATLPSSVGLGTPFEGAKDLAGTVELAGGMTLALSLSFADPAEATKRASALQQQFDAFKGGIVSMGLPQAITDSVRIVPAGAQVFIHATASEADVRAMRSKIGPSMTP